MAKKGKITTTFDRCLVVEGANFECHDLKLNLNSSSNRATYGILSGMTSLETAPNFLIKNCDIEVLSTGTFTGNSVLAGIFAQKGSNGLIENCTISVTGQAASAGLVVGVGLYTKGSWIKNCKISVSGSNTATKLALSIFPYSLANNVKAPSIVSIEGAEITLPEGGAFVNVGKKCTAYTRDIVLTGVTRGFVNGDGFIYADNITFPTGDFHNYESGITYLSNCVFNEKLLINDGLSYPQSSIVFGAGCNPIFEEEPESQIIYTDELYRKIEEKEKCSGKDFEVLVNYMTNSILS